jgi:hypothetical protein
MVSKPFAVSGLLGVPFERTSVGHRDGAWLGLLELDLGAGHACSRHELSCGDALVSRACRTHDDRHTRWPLDSLAQLGVAGTVPVSPANGAKDSCGSQKWVVSGLPVVRIWVPSR